METQRKRKIIYTLLFIAILIINVLVIVIFRDRAAITKYSIPSIAFAVCSVVYVGLAFSLKSRGNLFVKVRDKLFWIFIRLFSGDKDYTENQKYKNDFNRDAFIYCASIPTYITISFL